MARDFTSRANLYVRGALGLILAVAVIGVVAAFSYARSEWVSGMGRVIEQPVPFSHAHHVGGLGIDCRYCHTTVEFSSFAGMPATATCMRCHRELWTNAELLEPVRESYRTGQPIRWQRVYDLPDFVFFDHSIHVTHGIGCESCHGRVDQQPLMAQRTSLFMRWCLDCHRDPAPHLRPLDEITTMGYQPSADAAVGVGERLMRLYDIQPETLTSCSACHW